MKAKKVAYFILILCCALIVLPRALTYDEPLERDLCTYAVIGHEMNLGRRLYTDVWDHKPPAIYAAYALGEKLTGYGPQAVFLLNIATALLTLLGVYFTTTRLTPNAGTALWAAAFWSLISADLRLEANQPNTEAFINACQIWAFACILPRSGGQNRLRFLVSGLLLALASLFKPVAVVLPLFFSAALVSTGKIRTRLGRRTVLWQILLMAAPFFALWLLCIAYFKLQGRLADFWNAVVIYNQNYARNPFYNLLLGFKPEFLFSPTLLSALPLIVLALLGALSIKSWRFKPGGVLTLAYGAALPLIIALPGRFYPHYYQLWLPFLAVTAALAIHHIEKSTKWKKVRNLRLFTKGLGLAIIIALLLFQIPALLKDPETFSYQKYGTDLPAQTKRTGKEIKLLLLPHETFFQLGSEPGLYFYSQISPVIPVLLHYHLSGPLAEALSSPGLELLSKKPPDLFVVARYLNDSMDEHPFMVWMRQNYEPFPQSLQPGAFKLFFRINSGLGKRLAQHESL